MMIDSLLDTDLYKLTMMQVVLHQFPGAMVEYRFKCRNQGVDLSPYVDEIQTEIEYLCQLRFTRDELDYLSKFSFFKQDFIEFLRIFQLSPEFVHVTVDKGELGIYINGPWLHTIMFEVPILAIVGEVYYRANYPDYDLTEAKRRLTQNIELVRTLPVGNQFRFSEFGTRRRFSQTWQEEMVAELMAQLPQNFTGTSNVDLARRLGTKPIGTMAHEYFQACQALGPRLLYSQKFALEKWAQEYRGELGIALSDTYGADAFLRDFDLYFCKLFDGARQDSGDPIEWGDKLLQHYRANRVDPRNKIFVFSDGLTFPKAIEIYEHFVNECHPAFGIGTNLSNDVGIEALQNVIKMIRCNNQPVAKVSDSADKLMCEDPSYLKYLREVFQID